MNQIESDNGKEFGIYLFLLSKSGIRPGSRRKSSSKICFTTPNTKPDTFNHESSSPFSTPGTPFFKPSTLYYYRNNTTILSSTNDCRQKYYKMLYKS